MRLTYDVYFMCVAKLVATRSTCVSRPVGAVIVKDNHILSTGYNGALPNQLHCTDYGCNRRNMDVSEIEKQNYCVSAHAEANALAQAAKMGISVDGSILYTTLAPCYSCFKLLHSAGVSKILYEYMYESPDKRRDEFWVNQIKETGIRLEPCIPSTKVTDFITKEMQTITSKRKL